MTATFALGALLFTALFAVATLGITRQVLLTQREDSALQVAFTNAGRVQRQLTPEAAVNEILANLSTTEGSRPLIRVGEDDVQSINVEDFGPDDIPDELLALVEDGRTGHMLVTIRGEPNLVIGIPLVGSVQAEYFEAVSLAETQNTLETLQVILFVGAGTIILLAGVLGWWASRRALAPLSEASEAAEAIAGGRLDTRIDAQADRDLASLAASFNEMAGALESRIERDARFASEVSHELRSPLMTLTASVEVLENNRDDLPERAQTALDLLADDLERFKQLVEDLLEISRFDAGAAQLALDEVLIVEFVGQAVGFLVPGNVPVDVEPVLAGAIVSIDKRRLMQVLSNLLDNAEKYGGGVSRVAILPGRDDHHLRIAVEDNGDGVPADERAVIFDRFSRGSAGGRRGADTGVGLGLSLVAEHVQLHGGEVWVEDGVAGGARFVIELPRESARALEHA
ncbi:MAG: HAMP domain-containing histidine kinase [Acidimicrobiia bacterium]|nr:HAMP domain-containing histidine kinase [Acidimicrobiia bacterium]